MKNQSTTVIGKGIYTLPEAARLAKVPSARIARWLSGYERAGVTYPPLWKSELHSLEDEILTSVSFADLMEAKVIAGFYRHGVRIQTVREAIERARDLLKLERPFSSQKFQTDGKRIFIDLKDAYADDEGLMDIVTNQRAFRNIVQPTFKDIDFEKSTAVRWWPLGKNRSIVVDPARALGRPIESISGVPIGSLIDALGNYDESGPSKNDIEYVARLFEVKKSDVLAATEFDLKFAA